MDDADLDGDSMIPLRPGQILVSRTGGKFAYVRTEARAVVVGEAGKRLLMVPVNGGEEVIVVRTLNPVRDNAGKWWPGQELNGRYSQKDIDAGILTPTDDMAPETVPDEEPRKRAGKTGKEAAVSKTKNEAAEERATVAIQEAAAEPQGGVDVPVVNAAAAEPKVRKKREPKGPALPFVKAYRFTAEEIAEINAAVGDGKDGEWGRAALLSAARIRLVKPTQG